MSIIAYHMGKSNKKLRKRAAKLFGGSPVFMRFYRGFST